MISLTTIFIILLLNYLSFLYKVRKGIKIVKNSQKQYKNDEFVSVIIPFRNEEKVLLKSIKSLENQTESKSNYEVIYVDDNSNDDSVNLIRNNISCENIRVINSDNKSHERGHKKQAIKIGIENAKGDIIITTDADCVHGTKWLQTMKNSFDDNTGFVSGPVEFLSKNNVFDELQKVEFKGLILTGAGLIGISEPIICNAANLGFRKSAFYMVNGYNDNFNLSSGDDEFLMQKIFYDTNYKVKFCFMKDAISYTQPNASLKDFYFQRKRWASKSLYYVKRITSLRLLFIFLFYFGLLIQLLIAILYSWYFSLTFIFSFFFKIIVEYLIINIDSSYIFEKTRFNYFLLAEIFHVPYIIISSISGLFGNYIWKDRKIKR